MKYINEFRNLDYAEKMARAIKLTVKPRQHYQFMEFCGGHTHAIHRYGLPNLLPQNIELIHGPGCPVCVLPISRLDQAIALAKQKDIIFCSYGDMLRVPGSNQMSLLKAKSEGADVRMIYSIDDVLALAEKHPKKKIIFFAIGFETTTPPTAAAIKRAEQLKLKNFFVFCNHVLTPPALSAILNIQQDKKLNGIIGPSHVSVIIGSEAYVSVSQQYQMPIVIAGFEPCDILQSILMLVTQVNEKKSEVQNQYTRAVIKEGNQKAKEIMNDVFTLRESFEWRGLGAIPKSALKINDAYAQYDVEQQFELIESDYQENTACHCGLILSGLKKPTECPLFGKACNPETPMGACMVSSEGACAALYGFGE